MSLSHFTYKKLLYTAVFALALFTSLTSVSFAQDEKTTLQETINQLLVQVQQLQQQVTQQSGNAVDTSEYIWNRDLKMGDKGDDVQKLQQFLNADTATQVSVSGAGSAGSETTYFGPATARALKRFQEKYKQEILNPNGLSEGSGYFGASSQKKIKDILIQKKTVIVQEVDSSSEAYCPVYVTPTCTADESLTGAGVDSNGCLLQLSCISNTETPVDDEIQESASETLSSSPERIVDVVPAGVCSAQKMDEILAPATTAHSVVGLKCSPTLTAGDVVTKKIVIERSNASGVVVDCNGGVIDGGPGTINQGIDMVIVRSRLDGGVWNRPEDVTIKNCTIKGGMRVYGMGITGADSYVHESSKTLGHTERQQAAAPTRTTIENVTFIAQGRIPLFLSPGVTYTTVKDVTFAGTSNSTSVYLAAESAYNTFERNDFTINPKSSREVFAVDGSAHNVIKNNTFSGLNKGGIFLYRNCGESGTIRHQKPQYNEITGNEFYYNKYKGGLPAIWLGSRTGTARSYCNDDAGYSFGSSIDNGSFAENNTVTGNKIVKLSADKMIRNATPPNTISGNGTIAKRGDALVVDLPVESVAKTACPLYQAPICKTGESVVSGTVGDDGCVSAPQCVVVDQVPQVFKTKVASEETDEVVQDDDSNEDVSETQVEIDDTVGVSVGASVISTASHTTKNRLTVFFSGLKKQSKGAQGKILAGPGHYNGKVWWKVAYDNGISAWSPESVLDVQEGEVLGVSITVDAQEQMIESLSTLKEMLLRLQTHL